ncbi:hypothetical protein SBV1_3520008 [Verrucomicrobia bacterium]|nr:hypothetical protein SBV1_3520008 [Verrucomicrobiota bacterium]
MTIDDFTSSLRSYWRSELLRGALFMALLGATSLPTVFVVRRLDRAGFDTIAVVAVSVSYAVIAALMFYVLAPMRRKYLRKLQGDCPTCGKLLLGKRSRAVIASGRCPDCGSQILQ